MFQNFYSQADIIHIVVPFLSDIYQFTLWGQMKLNKALSFTEKKIIAELLLNWGIKSCVPIQA